MRSIGKQKPDWMRLDNAATIFPSLNSPRSTSFYRLSVSLHKPVDPGCLQKALDRCLKRFPYYSMRLKQGAFWMFLEHYDRRMLVEEDQFYPCLLLKTPKQKDHLLRILYLEDRISMEMSHILTDGTGAIIFLKNLSAEYLRQSGIPVDPDEDLGILDLDGRQHPDETIDAYRKIYQPQSPKEPMTPNAYQLRAKKMTPWGVNRIITGIIPTEQLQGLSRKAGVTITEYLVSVLMYTFLGLQAKERNRVRRRQPVRILVPVNLRKFYPIKNMRNFSLVLGPEIDPKLGEFSFEEILSHVRHDLRKQNTEKNIRQQVTRNVFATLNPIFRAIPLTIKESVFRLVFDQFGEKQLSISFSNLGNIEMPAIMKEHIRRFDFVFNGSPFTKTLMTMTGYNGSLYLSFGRICDQPILEKPFFMFLKEQGIDFVIESNNTAGMKDLYSFDWEER